MTNIQPKTKLESDVLAISALFAGAYVGLLFARGLKKILGV